MMPFCVSYNQSCVSDVKTQPESYPENKREFGRLMRFAAQWNDSATRVPSPQTVVKDSKNGQDS